MINGGPFGIEPPIDLLKLVDGRTGILSVDTDFFIRNDERLLAAKLETWLTEKVAAGVPVTCRDDHVDLVDLVSKPVGVLLNFDSHMDLSLGFLFGEAPHVPPQDATVFETILATDLTDRYMWAHPVSRSRDAARVYAMAAIAGRQPLVRRIHCLLGVVALQLLDQIRISSVFVCRSPGYATAETEVVFRRLREIAEGRSPSRQNA